MLTQNMSVLTSIITTKEIMVMAINMRRLFVISTRSSTSIKVTLKGVYLLTNNVPKGLQLHQLFSQASAFLSKLMYAFLNFYSHCFFKIRKCSNVLDDLGSLALLLI